MAKAAVRTKTVLLLLLIHCLLLLPLRGGGVLLCYAIICVLSSFTIILMGKREPIGLVFKQLSPGKCYCMKKICVIPIFVHGHFVFYNKSCSFEKHFFNIFFFRFMLL